MNHDSLDGSQTHDFQSNTTPRKQSTRPACTHTSMVRVYGNFTCQMCNKKPHLGFVYLCHQDLSEAIATSNVSSNKRRKLRKAQNEQRRYHPSSAKQLESLGFSKSVVKAAESGNYTSEQIELLKEQKRMVKKTIRRSIEERDAWKWTKAIQAIESKTTSVPRTEKFLETRKELDDKSELEHGERRHVAGVQADTATAKRTWHSVGVNTPPSSVSKAFETCDFRVCHTCRPFFRDRVYVPFEAALYSTAPPTEKWIPQLMPIASVEVMKCIGLDKTVDSDNIFTNGRNNGTNEPHDLDDTHELTHQQSTAGFRESLEKDFENMIANQVSSEDSGKTDPFMESGLCGGNDGGEQPREFDLFLWKSLSDAILDQAAQIPLPGADGKDGLDKVAGRLRGLTITWPDENPIPEESGTEPEMVEGGLALTEEAFANQSPDIITSV